MNYRESLGWLFGLTPRGMRFELDRMRDACARFGSPERAFPVVHVAGTNGKGSVSAMIERALRSEGHRVGLYTSPHLHSFRERIRIDGKEIPEAEVAEGATSLRQVLEEEGAPRLTFFEAATLLAFNAFRQARVDIVVLEVGLGGRLDATNVAIDKRVCVITSIALDHQAYLGDDLASIAREKAGIAVPNVPLVVGPLEPIAQQAIREVAARVGSPMHAIGASEPTSDLRLSGAHQRINANVARKTLELLPSVGIPVTETSIACGLSDVHWPARLERVGKYILDVAHNPAGAEALAAHLASLPERPETLIFGAMRDKDWRSMLRHLTQQVDRVLVTAPLLERSEPAHMIERFVREELRRPAQACESMSVALAEAERTKGLTVIAGSVFVVAPARAQLLDLASEDPIPF